MVSDQIVGNAQRPIGAGALPPRSSIAAHELARIATCENGMRLFGMGDQRLYAAIERERGAMPCPRLSGIRTVPYAPASRSQTYTVVRRHRPPPSVSVPASPRKREHCNLRCVLPTNGSGTRSSGVQRIQELVAEALQRGTE
jgi:hypothetical protein